MSVSPELLLAYFGDDFTGSTDALEFLSRAGVRTALFIQPPTAKQLSYYPGLQAIGVAGLTRSMAPDAMRAELTPAFDALRALGARHVHYKVCSTFDSSPTVGSIGCAIDTGAEVFGSTFVPLVVGAPALGRYCLFGNLFARMGIGSAGAIYRLDRHPSMSRHPVTPADEADLRLHLAKQTKKRISLFDILHVALPDTARRAALEALLAKEAPEIVLFDVLETAQLENIGVLIDSYAGGECSMFSVGSSAIEMALGAHWAARGRVQPRTQWREPGPAQPLLVMSGSCSPVTGGQVAWALSHGFADVPLDATLLAAGADCAEVLRHVVAHLRAGRHVVAHTCPDKNDAPIDAAGSANVGRALGRIAREAMAATGVRRLVVAGGDTSSYAARELGIEAVEMQAPLAPGAPLCRAHAPGSPIDGCEVNFKGGQVGAEDYFGAVARGRI